MLDNKIALTHLSLDVYPFEKLTPMQPHFTALENEDTTIARVSFSTSLEKCVQAIGVEHVRQAVELNNGEVILYTILVNKERVGKDVLTPSYLQQEGLVPDAIENNEYWLTTEHTVNPMEVYLLHIRDIITDENGNVVEVIRKELDSSELFKR